MEKERNYENLVNEAKKIAFLSLRNFFKNINLSSDLFSHLFETNIQIDYTEDITEGDCATYDPNLGRNKDIIYLGIDYLDDMFDSIENGENRNVVILDIANSIVHELIHKCRLVTLKQEVSLLNAANEIIKSADLYHDMCEEVKEYDDLLALSLLKPKCKGKYIPIKVYIHKDTFYTFIAYNKKSKYFDIFKKQIFDVKYDGDLDKFLLSLALEASSKYKHAPTTSYKSFLAGRKDIIYNSMDLYTLPLNDHNNPIDTKQKVIDKLSEIKYFIHYQEILEEAITEVLSNMIIMSRNKDRFEVESLSNRLYKSNEIQSLKSASYIINKGGINLIKGFILSPYEEEYRNILYEYYKDDFNRLLSLFSKLDVKENTEEISSEINDITDKRLTR